MPKSSFRIIFARIIACLLALAGIGSVIFWGGAFITNFSAYPYLSTDALSLGIAMNIGIVLLFISVILRIVAAAKLLCKPEATTIAAARSLTAQALLYTILGWILNFMVIFLVLAAIYKGVFVEQFYLTLICDPLIVILSIVQILVLRPWRRKLCPEGAKSARKPLAIAAAISLVACIVINLCTGIPILKHNAALKNIDAFRSFSLQSFDGETVTEEALRGKTTILNIWETTCGPCKSELPSLESVSQAYADSNVQFIGLCYDLITGGAVDEAYLATAKEILADAGVTYPNLIPTPELEKKLSDVLDAFPTTIILDENGSILEIATGSRSEEEWSALASKYAK